MNKRTDWVFVGDGKNDVPIAKAAPRAFGITLHAKLKEVAGLVEINSFMELLPYLDEIAHSDRSEVASETTPAQRTPKPKDDIAKLQKQIADLKKQNSRPVFNSEYFSDKPVLVPYADIKVFPEVSAPLSVKTIPPPDATLNFSKPHTQTAQ